MTKHLFSAFNSRFRGALFLSLLAVVGVAVAAGAAADSPRPWTVADSVAVRYVAPFYRSGKIHVAPDGEHFAVVVLRGDLPSDTNVYELYVFSASDIDKAFASGAAPSPMHKLDFRSNTNEPAISQLRWIDDGRAIAFLGAYVGREPQIHRLDIATGSLTRLTDVALGVYKFGIAGSSTIYLARTATGADLHRALYPGRINPPNAPYLNSPSPYSDSFATFVAFDGGEPLQVGAAEDFSSSHYFDYWVSPDGAWAIVLRPLFGEKMPERWRAYGMDDRWSCVKVLRCSQFELIDLKTNVRHALLNAPTGAAVSNHGAKAIWSPDSRRVMLVNTMLPLDGKADARRITPYIVEYDVQSRDYQIVGELRERQSPEGNTLRQPIAAEWEKPGVSLRVSFRTANAGVKAITYRRTAVAWRAKDAEGSAVEQDGLLAGGYRVSVTESMNEAPQVVVTRGDKSMELLPPDPALANVIVAKQEELQWRDTTDNEWKGGLSLPPEYAGGRLPLVVQAYRYEPDVFRPDGVSSSGYASQALSAKGFAVLRMPLRSGDGSADGTPAEVPLFVEGLDAAVEELSRRGIVDPDRVGLIGWSRGGFITKHAVTNPGKVALRAAVAADGFGASYYQYLQTAWEDNPGNNAHYEHVYGGSFWNAKDAWLAREPSFNADRASAALLLAGYTYGALLEDLHLYGAFRLNGKAADILYLPYGAHSLVRPAERLVSMQATVDWFSFWLKNEERSELMPGGYETAASLAEQYSRWRAMRAQLEAAKSPEPGE